MTVHNLGSINVDHVYRVPHLVRPGETLASRALETVLGGKGANQSVALARAGARVRHVGRIGAADGWVRDALAEAAVDVSAVLPVDGPSGHAIIQVDDGGENAIVLHGGANRALDAEAVSDALASAASGERLLLQNETSGVAEAFGVALERGLSIAFNPAPMSDDVARLPLDRCDTLILNETEATMLAEADGPGGRADAGADTGTGVGSGAGAPGADGDVDALEARLAARYPDVRLVLTLGARGARLRRGDVAIRVAAFAVEALDTTGAGDTFVGYLLAALEAGEDERVALERACAAAALSVTTAGATPSIPDAVAVDRFLAGEGRGS